jgi:hypothetical protein
MLICMARRCCLLPISYEIWMVSAADGDWSVVSPTGLTNVDVL